MNQLVRFVIKYIFIFFPVFAFGQEMMIDADFDPEARGENGLRIIFYNVENLFDTFDDPLTADQEYTPESEKSWTHFRYKEKLNHIAKTLIAAGGWEAPDLIGLCEVENFQVLLDLTTKTPLQKFTYQIIHENSPDSRGIDCAILYRATKLQKIDDHAIEIGADKLVTRDLLYASFEFNSVDTLHILVNHWPSRYGGKEVTEGKRLQVARQVRKQVDQLQIQSPMAKVLIMGDFNDEPNDISMTQVLSAGMLGKNIDVDELYNMSMFDFKRGMGTIVHRDIDSNWYLFDQMIVTGSLLTDTRLTVKGKKNYIFCQNWLLKDGRPHRSYRGPIYTGGFSDHLPIFIDLYYRD